MISWGHEAAWVRVEGELDLATSSHVDRSLAEAQSDTRLVVVDLRLVTFMDSAGVHALLDADGRARREGDRLLVAPGPVQIKRLLALTGLSERLEILELDPADQPAYPLPTHREKDAQSDRSSDPLKQPA